MLTILILVLKIRIVNKLQGPKSTVIKLQGLTQHGSNIIGIKSEGLYITGTKMLFKPLLKIP